jgi:hypothetical protein
MPAPSATAETIGRVEEQHELIERVASTVSERYAADIKLPEGTEAILLRVYFDGDATYQLAPPANAGRWPWQLLEEEVAEPVVDDIPGIEELLELAAEDDAVLQTYFDRGAPERSVLLFKQGHVSRRGTYRSRRDCIEASAFAGGSKAPFARSPAIGTLAVGLPATAHLRPLGRRA